MSRALSRLANQVEMLLIMKLIDRDNTPTSYDETLAALIEAWTELGHNQCQIEKDLAIIKNIAYPPPPLTRHQFKPTNPEKE